MTAPGPGAPSPTGSDRLRAAISRLARQRLTLTRRPAPSASGLVRRRAARPLVPLAEPAAPVTDWERRADERLARLERKLTNQNRLLVLATVSAVADILYRAAFK